MHTTMPLRLFHMLCLFIAAALPSLGQTILLPERWQFRTGDDSSYTSPSFDDHDWKWIDVPAAWEPQGFEGYNGTAWYRVHFTVSSIPNTPLTLALGKVDDADVTYLNGVRIGSMGRFPPDSATAYQELRLYRIPPGLLKHENLLAVRVYDMMGPGGIVFGPIGIYDERARKAQFDPGPGPKRSFHQLVTSNGLIAAVYNEQRGVIENVRPHIFQAYDSARFVEPFVYRIRPTLTERPKSVAYHNQTHVIRAAYNDFEINYVAPFTTGEKIFYIAVKGNDRSVRACSFTYDSGHARLFVDSILLTPGRGTKAVKYFLFGFTDSLHHDSTRVARARTRLESDSIDLVDKEAAFMRAIIAGCSMPRGITPAERRTLEQSVTVLKMAQVSEREVIPGARGQILASLPPGGWNIAWVRDGTYAIQGMNRLGMFDEARRALAFMLHAKSGQYVHYTHTDGVDYGIGVPYQISVCRYFGSGREESDYGEVIGPNIELDGFGLFLSALCDYTTRSRDTAFLAQEYATLSLRVADAILASIDSATGLIRRDSGPWERHLPGKQFAYTSIACAAGLRDFAGLAGKDHLEDASRYRKGCERLLDGIRRHLIVDRTLIRGNTEAVDSTMYDYFDGGTFEAFADGLADDKKLFTSHYNAYRRALAVPKSPGFSRINKGDWYETAEWILLDLRAAAALCRFGNLRAAEVLTTWVTRQAALNFNLIPELFDRKTSFYDGAVPMVGFGAGAYAVALDDLRGR